MSELVQNDFKPKRTTQKLKFKGAVGDETIEFHICSNGGLNITVNDNVYFTINPEEEQEFLKTLQLIFDAAKEA